MDRRLMGVIEALNRDGKVKVSEDFLISVFEMNFNPEKHETKHSELKRWLEWASLEFKFEYWKSPPINNMPEIFFKSKK